MSDRPTDAAHATSISPVADGRWVVPPVSYVDPERRFCAYCGRPLARRFWEQATRVGAQAFCDPTHAAREALRDIS
jgi:hypothetical protein